MENNKYINLEELSITTQALLAKINEQSNLKVNKANINAELDGGIKIAEIEGVDIYAPNGVTFDDIHNGVISYLDLSNQPLIPAAQVNSDWNATSGVAQILNKPTIPTTTSIYNATSTAAMNGVAVSSALSNYVKKQESNYDYTTKISNSFSRVSGYITLSASANTTSSQISLSVYETQGSPESAILINANKVTIDGIITPTSNLMAANKKYVDDTITSAIGNINSFDVAIVSSLPTTNIKEHTIYFMSNSNSGTNVYDEYMYINSNWELIGSTQIDLSNYVTAKNGSGTLNTDFVGTLINSENNELSLQYIDDTQQKSSGILINSTGTDIAGMDGMPLTIRGLSSPINNGDAANKQYVDSAIAAIEIPVAELDANVESMLDSFNLDYTSNSSSPNVWQGGSY